jgi:NADPH:quinone reductase-like Zn-dependent oxidoreductase
MKAILRTGFGGPEVLTVREHPAPQPAAGEVLIDVRAFGINHAELHMRRGEWPEAAAVSGIECAGVVRACPGGEFSSGQTVVALMGGMGRTRAGSYAEQTCVPASNVVAVNTDLPWEELAALPESYATAWACLQGNLELQAGQTLLVRGATSALGQAAVNIAVHAGARVLATTRRRERLAALRDLGAQCALIDTGELGREVRQICPDGLAAVLELTGNSTLLDSLTLVRPGGRLCLAGFLGGLAPIAAFNPLLQMPSRVHLSFFGSFVFGMAGFALRDVPLQQLIERVAEGEYRAKPARVFPFGQIADAHGLVESGDANGKVVVRL